MTSSDPVVVRQLEDLVDEALRQYEDGGPVNVQDRINRLAEEWDARVDLTQVIGFRVNRGTVPRPDWVAYHPDDVVLVFPGDLRADSPS